MKPTARIRVFPILLLFTADAPCAPVPTAATSAWPPASSQKTTAATAPSLNYRLVERDVVQFKVFQEPDLETTARVSKDGTVAFPLIGTVQIGGQTVQDAAQTIQGRLREYLVKPQVTVRILEYSKRRFTVLGQVSKAGTYDLPDDTTLNLLEAIGMAGGYTRSAKPSRITLKRIGKDGKEVTYKLDAKKMAGDKDSPRFEVLPGDTIVVAESLL